MNWLIWVLLYLKMDLEKVKVIQEITSPRNIFEVRSFHGLSIFYRKFIRNFSKISDPIIKTNKKEKQTFKWIVEAEKNFQLLKKDHRANHLNLARLSNTFSSKM